jgi:hypothetical protein
MFDKVNRSLDRIATALERIANTLEASNASLKPVAATDNFPVVAMNAHVPPLMLPMPRYLENSVFTNGGKDCQATCEHRLSFWQNPIVPSVAFCQNDHLRFSNDQPLGVFVDDNASFSDNTPVNETQKIDPLQDFLALHGITIRSTPPEDPADQVINSLSLFLGDHYDSLKRILATIKRNMQQGSSFSESIKNYSQESVSDITQFCKRLHTVAFLEEYKYLKSPQYLIKAKTTTLPKAQQFFSGQWLERFVLQKVQTVVNQLSREMRKELDFSYLLNPQIVLPNGDNFEMDLLFQVNHNFFWIEAKSGEYQPHIAKYAKMSSRLKLDRCHAIMVLADSTPDKSAELLNVFDMTVYSLHQLEEGLIATLRGDLA